jgi:hypothetical protein
VTFLQAKSSDSEAKCQELAEALTGYPHGRIQDTAVSLTATAATPSNLAAASAAVAASAAAIRAAPSAEAATTAQPAAAAEAFFIIFISQALFTSQELSVVLFLWTVAFLVLKNSVISSLHSSLVTYCLVSY